MEVGGSMGRKGGAPGGPNQCLLQAGVVEVSIAPHDIVSSPRTVPLNPPFFVSHPTPQAQRGRGVEKFPGRGRTAGIQKGAILVLPTA